MTNEDKEFFLNLIGGDLDIGFGKEYNLFCCEEAIKIANVLQTIEEIKKWHDLPFDEQKKIVNIGDGHSGNTFSMSCKLAISYLPMVKSNMRDKKIDIVIK